MKLFSSTPLYFESLLCNTFLLYCKTLVFINDKIKFANDNSKVFRYVTNGIYYSSKYVHSLLFNYRIEPMYNNWISVSAIKLNCTSYYTYKEMYDEIVNTEATIASGTDMFYNWYTSCYNIFVSETSLESCMLIMKYNNYYTDRICDKNVCDISPITEIKLSSIRFLSIEYIHSCCDLPIVLNIENGHYLNNNEILSPCFVRRLLEKQQSNYVFDMSYRINIIDNNINTIELNSNQYVILKADSYEIVNIN